VEDVRQPSASNLRATEPKAMMQKLFQRRFTGDGVRSQTALGCWAARYGDWAHSSSGLTDLGLRSPGLSFCEMATDSSLGGRKNPGLLGAGRTSAEKPILWKKSLTPCHEALRLKMGMSNSHHRASGKRRGESVTRSDRRSRDTWAVGPGSPLARLLPETARQSCNNLA
jgi:hypothetical protein